MPEQSPEIALEEIAKHFEGKIMPDWIRKNFGELKIHYVKTMMEAAMSKGMRLSQDIYDGKVKPEMSVEGIEKLCKDATNELYDLKKESNDIILTM